MPKYIEVEDARNMSGLRLVLSPGVPGPWSEAAKGIFYAKKIAYIPVRQKMGIDPVLREWTAQDSAPVAIYNDERPRSTWIDQLYLAERLAPEPALIPKATGDRVAMFGYSNELCGENGFSWSKRLLLFHTSLTAPGASEQVLALTRVLAVKYGYDVAKVDDSRARIVEILRALSARLEQQRSAGSRYFIGNQLSALDIYWACFCAIINPLPDDLCPMAPEFRKAYTNKDPAVAAAVSPLLYEHRDFIYHQYLELPVDN
ncbi:MAG TPA: glutathione S-transferase C-terminal domain-containing protein [Candidatus Binataceae bacterium]|nr:glutathione S-transferase C-terminal domain-containing protein [Candidatus Binataceae bacterium]